MTDTDRLAELAARAIDHGTPFLDVPPATIRSLVDDNRELRAAAEALVIVLVENGYDGWPETQDLRAALHLG